MTPEQALSEIDRLSAELEEAQLNLEAFRFSHFGAINADWTPKFPDKTWVHKSAHGSVDAVVTPGPGGCYWAIYRGSNTLRSGGRENPRDGMRAAEDALKVWGQP